ncbi:TonB-dependent receptor [Alterisphingorhabdus coralli]|uniref:TonB-dependent receptor n=1 Tax=Alterisphingorhabdus coralli TaxID=3071408 RepID=A0AA97F8T0_9SPHN|nr:TonB-dependent receptor [Parasphingorhabdus sp. SCSIO 66989]WOE75398.1 TonB-dependent receptor [Parasphingorhabdus sp. SCSIO 66989]
MRGTIKTALLGATALVAAPVGAQAQVDGQGPSTAEDDAIVDDDSNVIIVTARKVAENIQEVPTSIAVVDSENIQDLALDSLAEISRLTPGLTFDDSFGRNSNRPVIRGQANLLGDSGVAIFIDGIYFSGSIADFNVDNIGRVEVVKGPQSALYGRNTYAGAINIITKEAADQFEANIQADISEFDRYEITGGIRTPITDSLSAAVYGRWFDFGGQYTNQFDGEKVGQQSSYSISGALQFDGGGPFTASLRAMYNNTEDGQPALFSQSADANNCFFDDGALYGGAGRYFCGTLQPQQINTDFSRQFRDPDEVGLQLDTVNVAFRMDYEISDRITITSLTGYNSQDETLRLDGDYSPNSFQTAVFTPGGFPAGAPLPPTFSSFPFGYVGTTVDFTFEGRSETEDWSQELRLAYDGDAVDFLVGGYYFDQTIDSRDIREVPDDAFARAAASFGQAFGEQQALCAANPACASIAPFFGPSTPNPRNVNQLDIRNWAIFGSANVNITDKLILGLEGRYQEERIRQFAVLQADEDIVPDDPVRARETFKSFAPRVSLSYQMTPDNLLYASFAQGQKPGGFNGVQAILASQEDVNAETGQDIATFDEEDVTAYEIGIKNVFGNGAFVFNAAAFYNDVEGYQLTQNVQVGPNSLSAITNAGDARVLGLELEFLARPTDGLTITANYALADTRFTQGFDEQQGILNDVADDRLINCSTGDQFPDIPGCDSAFGSIKGNSIPRAPVHQIFADVDYRTPLGNNGWEIFGGANMTVVSSSFAQVHNLIETGGSLVSDARLGVQNENFRIQLYVDNLTDERALAQVLRFADGNNSFRRNFVGGLRPGRRFGILFAARY